MLEGQVFWVVILAFFTVFCAIFLYANEKGIENQLGLWPTKSKLIFFLIELMKVGQGPRETEKDLL